MEFVNSLIDFVSALTFYVWFATAIFWGYATLSFASWARLPYLSLWASLGALLPVVTLVAAFVTWLIKRESTSQSSYSTQPTADYSSGSADLF